MENNKPPIRTISPGRVFRNEAVSSRSHCFFHQVEGLYIDKDVSFADLKQTLLYFTKEMFGKSRIRLRPSYFPFTEPSAEIDIYWGLKTETDYRITKGTGWLEIGGCGMVDPNVLKNCGINPDEHTGFAFGLIVCVVMLCDPLQCDERSLQYVVVIKRGKVGSVDTHFQIQRTISTGIHPSLNSQDFACADR